MSSVYARRNGSKGAYPVAAAVVILAASPVFLQSGLAVPFGDADGDAKFAGISTFTADNQNGANGACFVEVEKQQIALLNAGDITPAHVGSTAYFTDARSISVDSSTNTRPIAGVVSELDDDLVWVQPAVV